MCYSDEATVKIHTCGIHRSLHEVDDGEVLFHGTSPSRWSMGEDGR